MNAANNKAIFMAAVTFAWAAITANAASVPSSDFLCWTVRDAYNELENVAVAFSYATVSVDGTYLSVYDPATGSDTGMTRVYTQAGGSTSLDEYSVVYSGKFDSSSAAGIMVELWDASRNRVAWQRYTIESARDNIWVGGSFTGGSGVIPLVVSNVVPEPTGGLLLLVGLAGLALRRKRHIAALAAMLMIAGTSLAGQNDALVTFSTRGPDSYADGTAVLDGECYALVWAQPEAEVTFEADGTVNGGKMLLAAPIAKGGRCPKVLFEVNADLYGKELSTGSWGVYLLDTRRWSKDGKVALSGIVGGRIKAVNATGTVVGASVSTGLASMSSSSVFAAAVADAETAIPKGAPKPRITGIRIDGANVYVTVKGTVPYLQYDLVSGTAPDAVTEKANMPQSGATGQDDEIIMVSPAKEGGAFFKVGRR